MPQSFNDILNPQIDVSPDPINLPHPDPVLPSLQQGSSGMATPDLFDNIYQQASARANQNPEGYDFRPMNFDWGATRADRYTKSQYLDPVGFKPDAGELNEYNYGQAQPWYKATWNAIAGTVANVGHGFYDQLSTWPDTISALGHVAQGDFSLSSAFQSDELDQINKKQIEFQNNYPIYQTASPDGFNWRSFAQDVQGLGALPGAILEMGAEQVGLGLLTAATFGGSEPIEAERALKNAQNLSKILDQTNNMRKSWDAFNQSKSLANAWDVLKNTATIGTIDRSGILPHIPGIGNTSAFVADALNPGRDLGLAKTSINGFHALYSDLRDINLAINMGQTSASSVYQNMLQKGQDDYKQKNGKNASGEDWQAIQDNAQAAAKKDGALNAVGAMMLNKLSFSNILTPSKSIQEAIASQGLDYGDKIGIRSTVDKEGNKLFVKADGWQGFKQSFLSVDWKGLAGHGLTFGTQMTTMSAIDKSTEAYYSAVYNKQNMSWTKAVQEGIDAQFTKEGAKTFISGFLTGAIGIGLVGDKITQSAKYGVERLRDRFDEVGKTERQQRSAEQTVRANDFVNQFNELWKNPINNQLKDVILQKNFAENIVGSLASSDKKGAQDAKSDATLTFLSNAAKNGVLDVYLDHLKDFSKNLTPEELFAKFYGKDVEFDQAQHNDLQKRLDAFYKQANDVKNNHNDILRKFPNPYNPYRFKEGTPERDIAMWDWRNYKESVALAAYHKSLTQDYIERLNNIMNDNGTSKGINNLGGFKSLPFTTVQALTDPGKLNKELQAIGEELKMLNEMPNKGRLPTDNLRIGDSSQVFSKNDSRWKTLVDRQGLLIDYQKNLTEFQNRYKELQKIQDPLERQQKLSDLREDYSKKLQPDLQDLANSHLKENNLDAITTDDLEKGMSKFMDYYQLTVDHEAATTYTNTILDPTGWGHYIGSMRASLEKMKTGADVEDKSTPPKPGEPTTKKFDGNLHGWNPKNKVWEPIVEGDVYNPKTGKWEPKPEPPEDKNKKKMEEQQTILKTHIDNLTDSKDKFEQNQTALTRVTEDHSKRIEELKTETEGLRIDLEKLKSNKLLVAADKAALVAKLEKTIAKKQDLLNAVATNRSLLQEQQDILKNWLSVADATEKQINYLKQGQEQITTTQKPIEYKEIEGELKNLGDEKTKFENFILQIKDKLKDINSQVKDAADNYALLEEDMSKTSNIKTIFDTLKEAKTKEQYQKALTKLVGEENKKPEEEQNKEALKLYKNLLAKINKESGTPETINDSLLDDLGVLSELHLNHLESQENALEELKGQEQGLYKVEDRIAYLKTIGQAITSGISTPKFPEPIYPEDLKDQDEDDRDEPTDKSVDKNDFGHFNLDEFAKPFNKTQLRSHQPQHFEVSSIKDRDGRNARISVGTWKDPESEQTKVFTQPLDQVRFSTEDLARLNEIAEKIAEDLGEHINNKGNIEDFKNVRLGNFEHPLKYFPNDTIVTNTEGTERMANTVVDMPLDMQGDKKGFLQPFNQDHNPYEIVSEDPDNIKVVLVNSKNQPIDKSGKVIENPTKDNINYSSIPGDKHFLESPIEEQRAILERLYSNERTEEDKKSYLTTQFGHPDGFESQEDLEKYIAETVQKILDYRQLVKYIRQELAEKRPVLLNIEYKTRGIPAFEPVKLVDGKKTYPKNDLQNRIVKPSKDYHELYHPNGQPIEIKFGNKGEFWFETKDGLVYPAETRKYTEGEITNLTNAVIEYMKVNSVMKSLRTEDQQTKRNFIRQFLKNTMHFLEPRINKDSEGKEIHDDTNEKDWIKNQDPRLGKNRVWIDNTNFYWVTANEEDKSKVDVLKLSIDDDNFFDHMQTILENLRFNVNKNQWNNFDPFVVPDFSKDDFMTNGEKHGNYRKFLLNHVMKTRMIEYGTKDANGNMLPQQKSVSLIFDLPQRDILIGKLEEQAKEIKPKELVSDIEAKRADIEKRKQEALQNEHIRLINEGREFQQTHPDTNSSETIIELQNGVKKHSQIKKEILEKYNAELKALEQQPESASEEELAKLQDLYNAMINPEAKTKETVESKDNLSTEEVMNKYVAGTDAEVKKDVLKDLAKDCDEFLEQF